MKKKIHPHFQTKKSMIAACFVITIQMTTLTIIAIDMFSAGTTGNRLGVPIGVSTATSMIQILALIISVFSQTDYQDSLNTLYIGYDNQNWVQQLGCTTCTKWRWHVSLWLRFFVSICGLVMTFFLIITESDTTQLLLDFTSIEFVTNLDNIFFWLCAWGYLGVGTQRDASKVALAKPNHLIDVVYQQTLHDGTTRKESRLAVINDGTTKGTAASTSISCNKSDDGDGNVMILEDEIEEYYGSTSSTKKDRRRPSTLTSQRKIRKYKGHRVLQKLTNPSRFPRFLTLLILNIAICTGWMIVFYRQKTGYYVCSNVYVEFDADEIAPELSTFGGLYKHTRISQRNAYIEEGHGQVYKETAVFQYCPGLRAWAFAIKKPDDDDDAYGDDVCTNPEAISNEIHPLIEDSYTLIDHESNEEWIITDDTGRNVPLPKPVFKCLDCELEDDFCGQSSNQGSCVVSMRVDG